MSSFDSAAPPREPQSEAPLERARGRCPSLQSIAYLNSGSYGLLADTVIAPRILLHSVNLVPARTKRCP